MEFNVGDWIGAIDMEAKKIAKVEPRANDHVLLVFEDGTQRMVQRDEHRKAGVSHQEPSPITAHTSVTVHDLKPGDSWPPIAQPPETPGTTTLAVSSEGLTAGEKADKDTYGDNETN